MRALPARPTAPTIAATWWDRVDTTGHPEWCARGHRCGLGEHRAQPVTLTSHNRGTVVLTRVQAADGRQHAEVRIRITLATGENHARAHLALIITALEALLRQATRRLR